MSETKYTASIHKIKGAVALGLLLCAMTQTAVQASPTNEIFSAIPKNDGATSAPKAFTAAPANAVAAPGAMDMAGAGGTPEVRWFEQMDSIVFKGYPTPFEKSILTTQFNQEAERVQQWTVVAQGVASRYRNTARALRNLPVPANWAEMDQYRTVRSNWFDDAATIYEDLTKPRRPARTIEELTAQLNDIDSRAQQLGKTKEANREMDRALRRKYRVHAPKDTDALTKYVTGRNP